MQVEKSSTQVITAQGKCQNIGVVELNIRIREFEKPWLFHLLADLEYPCILGIDFIGGSKIILDFDRKSLAIQDSQVEDIKVDEGKLRVDVDLVLSSREQLIEEQRTDPELGHIYGYLENPEDISVNATISSGLKSYPLKKAPARVIADKFFDNYISRFGAPIKLISDNGPQFISDIFENLSERLGIKHVKTVVYRPQANRTEGVNRDLVQMISNYVNEQHDTWDQFLREFAYAIRTAVNEATGKPPAELFLGRKLITPFQKLVMVSDGTEFAVGDIERLFEEARRNTKAKHEKWEKYNRRRRDVQIKVNDWVLIATHPLSSATRKVVAKFKPKFEGPYRVLDVKNNVVVWKAGKSRKRPKQDKVAVTTNQYNLRPRGRREVESRPAIERKTQQGGPVRSRKGRGRNENPYIEERTRSSNRNARRGSDQRRQDQERKGACTRRSLSLEVLQGKRQCETVRLLNVPRQRVPDAICRFEELGNDGRRPGCGRKRIVNTSRNSMVIEKRVQRNPRASMRQIARNMGINE
ncbi:retrovirus-related Pol polyprotein from transposon 17.6 [Trichonephila clavipes]|nr:retrovirus-related Pol polyprotein from transposon 17.6 [Trichonephila clavipes]